MNLPSAESRIIRAEWTTGSTSPTTSRAYELLSTVGYAAKGFVYLVVGALAVAAAIWPREDVEGSRGALVALLELPFGKLLLGAVSLGLIAYVAWRAVQASIDPEDKGSDASGIWLRVYYANSALSYAALTVFAVKVLLGSFSDPAGASSLLSDLEDPWRRALYALVAAGFAGGAIYGLWRAVTGSFEKSLNLSEVSSSLRHWLVGCGRLGLAARSLVFLVLAGSFGAAALRGARPDDTGTEGALATIGQSGGSLALIAVATGLIAYSGYQFVKARYRRVEA